MKPSFIGRTPRLLPALLAVGIFCAVPALAQPGTNGAPGMDGGPGMNGGAGGPGGPGGRGGNRPDRAAMQAMMLQRQLERAGYTDPAIVEAVTTYMTDREAARQPIRDAANALSQGLADENSTDADITKLMDDFDKAVAAEKTRNASAETELDKKVKFSKEPKLKAVLTLSGVIGEGAAYLGPQGGPGGRGGRGGYGGGQGGGRRGGGQGGGGQ